MGENIDFEFTVIGAGVVGLSIAKSLTEKSKSVLVIEKENKIGTGISSRNSQVIHAGMYYPTNSLKAKLCVEGNRLMYEYCDKKNISHSKIGKYIVAVNKEDEYRLEDIFQQGQINGVEGLLWKSKKEMESVEPNVKATKAIFSPNTGIVDVHSFMNSMELDILQNRGEFAFNHTVSGIEKKESGYRISLRCGDEENSVSSKYVINSAGLYSDTIAKLAGLDIQEENYTLHFCKGDYFRYSKRGMVNKLIYPVPSKNLFGLGVHATLELDGSIKFGPDVEYLKEKNEVYSVDFNKRESFFKAVSEYLSGIKIEDLHPDQSGIRPKLQGEGELFRDFVISEETEKGLPGFINLIGIESPGLTSSLAIGKSILEKL
ncbi:MAG: NAD(P)/FAD-dependent oxidoreductase [Leptospiraceae bacterium]|nr:NAD(P)/FAD-dependent oxidoreductase [Leptospiraceae bacterium]MCK6380622.1 NAD(P)/FAD-dependent oxidoreductase [Leptospiraceae bacterium]